MGGSIGDGNTTVSAEFNIYADPEAAAIVFESGLPITMMGLDVTHQAVLLTPGAGAVPGVGHGSGRVAAELVDYALAREGQWYGTPGCPSTTRSPSPTSRSGARRGRRVRRPGRHRQRAGPRPDSVRRPPVRIARKGRAPNAQVGIRIDRDRFEDILVDAYGRLP